MMKDDRALEFQRPFSVAMSIYIYLTCCTYEQQKGRDWKRKTQQLGSQNTRSSKDEHHLQYEADGLKSKGLYKLIKFLKLHRQHKMHETQEPQVEVVQSRKKKQHDKHKKHEGTSVMPPKQAVSMQSLLQTNFWAQGALQQLHANGTQYHHKFNIIGLSNRRMKQHHTSIIRNTSTLKPTQKRSLNLINTKYQILSCIRSNV